MKNILALFALALVLAACDKPAAPPVFNNVDITGAQYARDFALTDHTGKVRTLADFKGKVVFLFFGFTQCPDVCPTTMVEMASVLKALGPQADKVQVLFVTVDPERDTQELLAQYVPAFDPSFIGLYGNAAATAKVAKEFKVFYAKSAGTTPDAYSMDHTAGSYVFDPQGKIRLFVRHGKGAAPIAQDIKLLLKLNASPSRHWSRTANQPRGVRRLFSVARWPDHFVCNPRGDGMRHRRTRTVVGFPALVIEFELREVACDLDELIGLMGPAKNRLLEPRVCPQEEQLVAVTIVCDRECLAEKSRPFGQARRLRNHIVTRACYLRSWLTEAPTCTSTHGREQISSVSVYFGA